MKHSAIFPIMCIMLSGCAASIGITRNVKLLKDVSVAYGSAITREFQIVPNQDPILHDCFTAIVEAVVWNPAGNFRIPSHEAKLDIRPQCLRCTSVAGRTTERKLSGSISGENLKGEHYEEFLNSGNDIFGLGLEENMGGILKIDSLGDIGSCSGHNKLRGSDATK